MMTPATFQNKVNRQRQYDVNSLMSEHERQRGMTYTNSHRIFADTAMEWTATHGYMTPDEVIAAAPRIWKGGDPK